MRDFGVRWLEGSGTAILAVTDKGKMPVPRSAPCWACKVWGAREFPLHARRNERARSPQRLMMSMVFSMGR